MVHLIQSDLVISINSYAKETVHVFVVSSFDDIQGMDWVVGDRRPINRLSFEVPGTDGEPTLYYVKLLFQKSYVIQLQLHHQIVQEKYTGGDLVDYLMTENTHFGLFEEQEKAMRRAASQRFFADVTAVIIALVGGIGLAAMDSSPKPSSLPSSDSDDET